MVQGAASLTNINECSNDADNDCNTNASCTDNDGSYLCTCDLGYTSDGFDASTGCIDVDNDDNDNDGSFSCTCNLGSEGDGTTCNDFD